MAPKLRHLVVPLIPVLMLLALACGEFEHGSVTGRILDARDGTPLQGVRIGIGGEGAITDASGVFAIGGIRTGTKQMVITCDGYQLPGESAETLRVHVINAMVDLGDIGLVPQSYAPPQPPDGF